MEIFITVIGLAQGVLAFLDRRSNWIVYAVQMALLVWFSYYNRLYGDMLQSAVYMFICLFSFWSWKEGKSAAEVSRLSSWGWMNVICVVPVATVIVGYALSLTDDQMPYVDSFTTVTTVVALLLMSAHKVECWLVWLVNDISYMYQYFHLEEPALWLFGLYCVWTVMAVASYLNWRRISMKKSVVVSVLALLCVMPSNAQDSMFKNNSIWLERAKDRTLVVGEFKDSHERSYNYLYVESDISSREVNSTYVLASTDRKWWDCGIWIHGEFRTFLAKDFSADNIYLIGPNFELLSGKCGFLNLQTMYRYDGKNNFKVSLIGDVEYKRLYSSMIFDSYGVDKFYFHSENRLFFKIAGPVAAGGNLLVTLNEEEKGLKWTPMALIRIDL